MANQDLSVNQAESGLSVEEARLALQRKIQSASYGYFIFSEDTLNIKHLLASAYDFLVEHSLTDAKCGIGDLKSSILEVFGTTPKALESIPHLEKIDPDKRVLEIINQLDDHSLYSAQYHDFIEVFDYRHGDIALNPHTVWDDFESYCQSLAPEGFYFGSSEGDGSSIGFWRMPEEEEAEE